MIAELSRQARKISTHYYLQMTADVPRGVLRRARGGMFRRTSSPYLPRHHGGVTLVPCLPAAMVQIDCAAVHGKQRHRTKSVASSLKASSRHYRARISRCRIHGDGVAGGDWR